MKNPRVLMATLVYGSVEKAWREGIINEDLFTANVCGKGCNALQGRLQTFEAKVANVCGKGCKRLREKEE